MKHITFSLLLLAFAVSAGHSQTSSNKVVIGTVDSIYSSALKENRRVWVHVPNTNANSLYSHKIAYPVVYLLDGPAHFAYVTGMIQQLSGNNICPDVILVGIPNTNRTRELTLTPSSSAQILDSSAVKTSDGGGNFLSFIENELIPHIDSLYMTTPYRMLIGHSLGGLFVINTLINHPGLFNSYVAIDPSLTWDDRKLLKQAETVLQQKNFEGKALFLAVANTMRPGIDTDEVREDTSAATLHIRSILQFSDLLKANPDNNLRWSSKFYNEEGHGTVPLLAQYDAMHFLFSDYRMPVFANLLHNSFDAMGAILQHSEKVSKQLGYTVPPPEPFVNQLGYAFLQNKALDKARAFFEMNLVNYPESFNVYDSMGDYYSALGDKQKAIELFSKALSLREYPETRQKMEKLKRSK
jgi:uncharacterized protein